jgi:LmbE family N-acetylglucosaminyl deacetylase
MLAPHIFLSAHLDDAVLSCGGVMYQLTQSGEAVTALTVFAGDPPEDDLSPFAQSLHERWQANVADRRQEDRAALALLGAGVLHWPYADAVYRRDARSGAYLYDSEESIFGEVRDAPIVASIAAQLRQLDESVHVYAPLAAGHHVDHQIVRRAAESIGRGLIYYEDYPYAENPDALEAALGKMRWASRVVSLSEAAMRAKTNAVLAYRSQLSTFFKDDEEVADRLRVYAAYTGDTLGPCERLRRVIGRAYRDVI